MKKIIEKVVPKPELKGPEQEMLEKNKLLETQEANERLKAKLEDL